LAYLGNRPAESFASFEKQVFTIVNSQTAYTLSHSVVNENDIRLVVNNVVQEPGSGKAYTASGTTLTLSAALTNGTDEMYCVFLGRALQTVNAPNASVGSDQTAPTIITGQTAETSIATDDTILIHDTSASALRKMTRANFVSGIGGTNTPAFFVHTSSNQNLSDATTTKVTLDSEDYDTDNAFASNKFTVPSGEAGKYLFYTAIDCHGGGGSYLNYAYVYIYKNGSGIGEFAQDERNNPARRISITGTFALDLAVSDYIEIYVNIDSLDPSSPTPFVVGDSGITTYLGGHKLIGI
jgi:hypothetical protein